MRARRHRVLPARGELLISTDLHGNWEDFVALRAQFEAALQAQRDVHWAILGDLVHGPDAETANSDSELYAFPDDSPRLIDGVFELRERHPTRVHFVLGNHDAGHAGLAHTAKFHDDEVEVLERRLSRTQKTRLEALLEDAALMLLAPCGLVLSHGSGGDAVHSLALLDGPLSLDRDDRARAINELLWSYGQPREVSQRLLRRLSQESGLDLRVVVHGHDRDASGWFTEGGNQAQPVIFGAPRQNKRCLWVDLSARYDDVEALRDGHEVRHLHAR